MNNSAKLSLFKLCCTRGGQRLFQNIDCTLEAGRWLYVVGGNGVGKTSLLRMVCGLTPVEIGGVLWNGISIHAQREVYCQDLCYLGHLDALQQSMTVNENLIFTAALTGVKLDIAQTQEVLARFGLVGFERHLARHLSQGQKRRVALSRLAFSSARLWVLDEPLDSMDEAGVPMLEDLIAAHLGQGGLAVLTSHQQVNIGSIPAQRLELDT